MSSTKLRLASYNIHAGVGSDGRFDPHRLVQVLQQLDADIIGLQEVVTIGPAGFALLDELAAGCNMQAIAGPTMMRGDAHYGNALLCRHPVKRILRLDLSMDGFEPRGALSVELAGNEGITVVVTHLGLKTRERASQIEYLLDWLPPPPRQIVLLGDLNEWWPWSRNLKRLERRFHAVSSPRTFPARLPLLALDRILATSSHTLDSVRVHTEPPTRQASDHLPLVTSMSVAL